MSTRYRDMRRDEPLNEPVSTATKRAASMLSTHRQKRIYSPSAEPDLRVGPITEGIHHVRWLIESSVCSRVLGPGGKRLKYMKESTKDPSIQARISTKIDEAEYRIFSCSGSALSISKIVGLLLRYIYDEPETGLSGAESRRYDLKFLVPQVYTEKLAGHDDGNLREIEDRSNALVSLEPDSLPSSEEHCLHIFGVADSVQIAVYFTLETMKRVETALKLPLQSVRPKLFDPSSDSRLEFKVGQQSDSIPRLRSSSVGNGITASAIIPNAGESPKEYVTDLPSSFNVPSAVMRDLDRNLELPVLSASTSVPQSVYTAYDIARDSQRNHLRQVVQIDRTLKGSDADRATLFDNINRVTACKVDQGISGLVDHFGDDQHDTDLSLVLEGAPEENSLALLLIYRFLKKQGQPIKDVERLA